jgi:hypothetical protein
MPLVVQATLVARRFMPDLWQSASTGMIKAMKKITVPTLLQTATTLILPGM